MKRALKKWILERSSPIPLLVSLSLIGLIFIAFTEQSSLRYSGLLLLLLALIMGILFKGIEDEAAKPFTMYIDGGGTSYRAHCPELDISLYGDTEQEAKRGLYILARAEIRGILQGKGGPGDERKKIAELIADRLNRTEDLFRVIDGPAPMQRSGLK